MNDRLLPGAADRDVRRWRAHFRLPRRLRVERSGWAVCVAALVLGVAAIATGNNLLFLLLGALLGLIGLSGWMSEQALRGLRVTRYPAVGIVAGAPVRFRYEISKVRGRFAALALEVREAELPGRAFVPLVERGSPGQATLETMFPRRGVYRLDRLVVGTSYPFGLFSKERDLAVVQEVVVWPRLDRSVREVRIGGRRTRSTGTLSSPAGGARGEFRGLRDYRPGDDPRDVHWRSSARRTAPVVREYEPDGGETVRVYVDLRSPADGAAEAVAETAASLLARACERNQSFSVVTPDHRVPPGTGRTHLGRVLDVLAAARFRADAPLIRPPGTGEGVVLVTAGGQMLGGSWSDVIVVAEPE